MDIISKLTHSLSPGGEACYSLSVPSSSPPLLFLLFFFSSIHPSTPLCRFFARLWVVELFLTVPLRALVLSLPSCYHFIICSHDIHLFSANSFSIHLNIRALLPFSLRYSSLFSAALPIFPPFVLTFIGAFIQRFIGMFAVTKGDVLHREDLSSL